MEKEYLKIFSFSQDKDYVKKVANENNISAKTVSRQLKLLVLPEEIQKAVHSGDFDKN